MEITLKQLNELIEDQRYLCRKHFGDVFEKSDLRKAIRVVDPNEKIFQLFSRLNDEFLKAPFPGDLNVLNKYKIT